MLSRFPMMPVVVVALLGCATQPEPLTSTDSAAAPGLSAAAAAGLRTVSFPEQDPGPPFYTRVTTLLNQVFHANGYVAIPFYRDPACVPADFNLLGAFDPPGEHGPGAFACPLTVSGHFLIEPDAPIGTYPVQVVTRGPTPIWFVAWDDFQQAAGDRSFTMRELLALNPLRGVATQFHETLKPREENHHVVITSHGRLDDGRSFQFNVNHLGDRTRSIQLRIR